MRRSNLDELWRDIVTEWDESGTMKASWLPRAFREGRMLYTLRFPAGWWIDITATETIAALDDIYPYPWPTDEGPLSLDPPITPADPGSVREARAREDVFAP